MIRSVTRDIIKDVAVGIHKRKGGGLLITAPSGLVKTVDSQIQITITWDVNQNGQDGVKVYMSTDGVTYSLEDTVLGELTTCVITGLTKNTLYYFKIANYKGGKLSAFSNVVYAFTELWYLPKDLRTNDEVEMSDIELLYIPSKAASLAESYINLANPGTNDVTPGPAPTLSTKGWVFDGTKVLKTGKIPLLDGTQSLFLKFDDYQYSAAVRAPSLIYESATKNFGFNMPTASRIQFLKVITGYYDVTTTKGVLGIAGLKGFYQGMNITNLSPDVYELSYDLWIGATHFSSAIQHFIGSISDYVLYSKALSVYQAIALTERLNGANMFPVNETFRALKAGALICFNMPTFTVGDVAGADLDPNTFAPTNLSVDDWLDPLVTAGMGYAILTVKAHDGFMLWDSAQHAVGKDPYTIAKTTWYANNGQIDIVDEFTAKCRTKGLHVGIYFSIRDYTHQARTGTDQITGTAAYIAMITEQLTELLTNYGTIDMIWFDGWGWDLGYGKITYATIYNLVKGLQPNIIVMENNHFHPAYNTEIEIYEKSFDGIIQLDNPDYYRAAEEVVPINASENVWYFETGQNVTQANFKTSAEVTNEIKLANSKKGNYLLGIYPDTTGRYPTVMKSIIENIADF